MIKVFGCPAIRRELYYLASFCRNEIDVEIISPDMPLSQLQKRLSSIDADRIILAFGQRRLTGLHSGSIPLTAARAHDCAHLLLGSAERYRRIFSENDDAPCWIGRGCEIGDHGNLSCYVGSGIFPRGFELPDGTKEYIADLSLLKSLLDLDFDTTQAVTIPPNCRIISDPVEIISFEPL